MGLWFKAVIAIFVALRFQSAQHQSVEGPDRAFRRFRRDQGLHESAAVRLRHQCAYRAAAHFPHEKITADVILASACLPLLFRAVEIDGVPYWDGGYLGNPSIFPLFRATQTEDVLLIQINPLATQRRPQDPGRDHEPPERDHVQFPADGRTARHRIRRRLIDQGRLPRGTGAGKYRRINMHRIVLDRAAQTLMPQPSQHRLRFLRDAAQQWPARGAAIPRRALRRHRRARHRRIRSRAGWT